MQTRWKAIVVRAKEQDDDLNQGSERGNGDKKISRDIRNKKLRSLGD